MSFVQHRTSTARAGPPATMFTLKTLTLFTALGAIAALVGFIVGGSVGVLIGAAMVVGLAIAGASASEELVMRVQRAARIYRHQAPALFMQVESLAHRAGIPAPTLYLSPSLAANALTLRTNGPGALLITRGALDLLEPLELEAVLAHEIAHLSHGDTEVLRLTSMLSRSALTLLRVGTWLAVFGVLLTGGGVARAASLSLLALLLPPIVGGLHAALSRTRELAADATAARLTGRPLALASALTKLERQHGRWVPHAVDTGPRRPTWLRSHPSTEERVTRLLALARA